MPRPKRQTVYAVSGTDRAVAFARLQPDIKKLLTVANAGRDADPEMPPLAMDAHRVLLAISNGRGFSFHDWPEWAALAVTNVHSNVGTGDYHLRPCRDCGSWMLVKKSDRFLCPGCRKRYVAKQQAKWRRAERLRNRAAVEGAQREATDERSQRHRQRTKP